MYFLLFLLIFISVLIVAFYLINVKIHFTFNTDKSELYINIAWLRDIIKSQILMINYSFKIKIYLFNKLIYTKQLKKQVKKDNQKHIVLLNKLVFENSFAEVYYGFNDPFNTGIASSILQFLPVVFSSMHINYYPDFVPENEYIIINANTDLNIGKSINNIINNRKASRKNKGRKKYGTV